MKYVNRLKARLARNKLAESAKEGKNWIVSRKLILETEEGDAEFEAGDNIEAGATDDGNLALKGNAAVVVISDEDIAKKIADVLVNADELSDVEFEDRSALDALSDGEDLNQVVDDLADGEEANEEGNVEVPMVKSEQKESVADKFAKFSKNRLNPAKFYVCESILVDDEADGSLNMYAIKTAGSMKESFNEYKSFAARVSELNGSIQPGKREIALTEAGEVMGYYDTEADDGAIYPENSFKSAEEMDSFKSEPANLMDVNEWNEGEADVDNEGEGEYLESALKAYEESAKSGSDYMKLTESLESMKLNENRIAEIVSTFNSPLMESCVRAFDTKYGRYVAAFKESSQCSNFIEEAKAEGRFTKRFFN